MVAGSGKLDNVKCAIVSWAGTGDSPTSDIVSAWAVEGTNPTLATSWTYENTPANLGVGGGLLVSLANDTSGATTSALENPVISLVAFVFNP